MSYRLKRGCEAFEVVEGHLAGRKFIPGRTYEEIPAAEAHKFDGSGPAPAPEPAKPSRTGSKIAPEETAADTGSDSKGT